MSDPTELQITTNDKQSLLLSSGRATLISRGRLDASSLRLLSFSRSSDLNRLADLSWSAQIAVLAGLANELSLCARSAGFTSMIDDLAALLAYNEFQFLLTGYILNRIQGRKTDPLEDILKTISDFGRNHYRRELQWLARFQPIYTNAPTTALTGNGTLETLLATLALREVATLAEELTVCARSTYRPGSLVEWAVRTSEITARAVDYNELQHSLMGCLQDGLEQVDADLDYSWLLMVEEFAKKHNLLADLEKSLNRAYTAARLPPNLP